MGCGESRRCRACSYPLGEAGEVVRVDHALSRSRQRNRKGGGSDRGEVGWVRPACWAKAQWGREGFIFLFMHFYFFSSFYRKCVANF